MHQSDLCTDEITSDQAWVVHYKFPVFSTSILRRWLWLPGPLQRYPLCTSPSSDSVITISPPP